MKDISFRSTGVGDGRHGRLVEELTTKLSHEPRHATSMHQSRYPTKGRRHPRIVQCWIYGRYHQKKDAFSFRTSTTSRCELIFRPSIASQCSLNRRDYPRGQINILPRNSKWPWHSFGIILSSAAMPIKCLCLMLAFHCFHCYNLRLVTLASKLAYRNQRNKSPNS